MKMDNLESLLQTPLTRANPQKLKEALELAVEYIKIAENNGCTTFNEFIMYKQGFFPLEELKKPEDGSVGPEPSED